MRRIVFILAFILLLTGPCLAAVDENQQELYGIDGLEGALPDSARDAVGDLEVDDSPNIRDKLSGVWESFKGRLAGALRESLGCTASVLLIVLICSVFTAVFDYDRLPEYIMLAGCVGITAVTVGDVKSLIAMGAAALTELSDFSKALLPTLCTAAVSSGAISSAGAKYAATALFMDVLITVANSVIVPLIYAYIVSVIASCALGNDTLSGVTRLIQRLCVLLMTGLTIAFTAYLSITGAVTGTADALATKMTKTAISAALPVVGGVISDAASTVVVGAGILRNAVGIFGLLAVCAICVAPFAALGAQYLLYKLAAACTHAMPVGRLSKLIDGIGTACGMMLGLTGCGGVMLFLSIISSIKAVSGG